MSVPASIRATPAAGWYPFGRTGRTGEWDAITWTARTAADDRVAAPPRWHHRPFAFLGHLWFWLLVGGAVVVGVAGALGNGSPGLGPWRWLALPGMAAVMASMVVIFRRHLRFDELPHLRTTIGLGLLAGLVGVAVAEVVEPYLEPALGIPFAADLWLSGVVEETGKLLLPFLLLAFWRARFGDPRTGVLLVLISGAVFGVAEAFTYITGATGHDSALVMSLLRPVAELTHPIWSATAAALIWLGAYRAKRLLTLTGLVGWLIAAAQHSLHDGLGSFNQHGTHNTTNAADYATAADVWRTVVLADVMAVLFLVIAYLILRHMLREIVPPGTVAVSAPHWRPRLRPWGVPKHERAGLDVGAAPGAARHGEPAPDAAG